MPGETLEAVQARNARLRNRLERLTRPEMLAGEAIDAVVTMHEINDRHGTGSLLKRVLKGGPRVFSMRAQNGWGFQEFGDWSAAVPQCGLTRAEVSRDVARLLAGYRVRNVLCVPYQADELITATAVHEQTGAALCIWVMDDQNIAGSRIPDDLMREVLRKSCLRLTTHPELARAYERKFELPFSILPAVVPAELVLKNSTMPPAPLPDGSRKGALIGSFWEQSWFDRMCSALAYCGASIDWYGNNRSPWVRFAEDRMAKAGITAHGVVDEARLASELRRVPFAIVPVSGLDRQESNPGVARLSLPGRILFAVAASHTPILIVGSEDTCGARFVRHFGVGEVTPYDGPRLAAAMDRLARPEVQAELRANAARIGPALSARGAAQWLSDSIRLGKPADQRFEDLFAGYGAGLA